MARFDVLLGGGGAGGDDGTVRQVARLGVLRTAYGSIHTPASILPTNRGCVPFLTPDIIEELCGSGSGAVGGHEDDGYGVQVAIPQLLQMGTRDEDNASGRGKVPTVGMGGISRARESFGLANSAVIVAATRGMRPWHSAFVRKSSAEALSVSTPHGIVRLTPKEYMSMVATIEADVCVAIADEISWSKNAAAGAVGRSSTWLKECAAHLHEASSGNEAQEEGREGTKVPMLLGVVVGGESERARRASVATILETEGVEGVIVSGLGFGTESALQEDERDGTKGGKGTEGCPSSTGGGGGGAQDNLDLDVVDWSLEKVPEAWVRGVWGVLEPRQVLRAVGRGVDLFDGEYPHQVTLAGGALTFPTHRHRGAAGRHTRPFKLDLRESAFAKDTSPLLDGCECFACKNHTRAYIHHLLNCDEILGHTLLMAHNVYHYNQFFEAVRAEVSSGTLAEYEEWFATQQQQDYTDRL